MKLKTTVELLKVAPRLPRLHTTLFPACQLPTPVCCQPATCCPGASREVATEVHGAETNVEGHKLASQLMLHAIIHRTNKYQRGEVYKTTSVFTSTNTYWDENCILYLSSDVQQGIIIIINRLIIVQGRRHVYSPFISPSCCLRCSQTCPRLLCRPLAQRMNNNSATVFYLLFSRACSCYPPRVLSAWKFYNQGSNSKSTWHFFHNAVSN